MKLIFSLAIAILLFTACNNDADKYFKHGAELLKSRGNLKEALNDFNQGLKLNPDYAEGYFYRAIVKEKLEDHKGAVADYEKCLSIKDIPGVHLNLASIKRELNDNAGALVEYTKAIKLFPDLHDLLLSRAAVELDLKQFNAALVDVNQSLALKIDKPDYAFDLRGQIKAALKDTMAACQDFYKAKQIDTGYYIVDTVLAGRCKVLSK